MSLFKRWMRKPKETPAAPVGAPPMPPASPASHPAPPDAYQLHLDRGCELMQTHQSHDALVELTRAAELARDPVERAIALANRGRILCQAERWEAAIQDLSEVIGVVPALPDPYWERGRSYAGLNNTEAAIQDFSRAVVLFKAGVSMALAYWDRAKLYESLGAVDQAHTDLRRAAQVAPHFPPIPTALAQFEQRHGSSVRSDVANAQSQASVGSAHVTADQHLRRGWELSQSGSIVDSLVEFASAVEAQPRNPNVWYSRGVANCKLRRYQNAVSDLTTAISLGPGFAAALAERGLAYVGQGDFVRALADYDAAITANPDYAIAHIGKGSLYAMQGRWAEAIPSLDMGIQLGATPEAYFNRAAVRDRLGKPREAREDLATYLRLWPSSPLADQARRRLASLGAAVPEGT